MLSWIHSHPWLKNVVVAIMVAGTAFLIAQSAYNWERARGVKPFFYQSYYEPAIRMACGQPFGVDATCKFSLDSDCQISNEMKRFLKAEAQTLSCEFVNLPKIINSHPPARAWYHMFVMTAQIWKFTGISWPAIEVIPSILLAITAAFLFALFRLFMPTSVAAALAIVSILPALRFLPYLRDINKAPFILGALLVTAWLVVRTPTRMQLCVVMAATGIWLGIGYGFRPDVIIVLPLLMATILFFRPVAQKDGWGNGILALIILIGSFILAASPILSAFNSSIGSCQWHFGLLGLSDGHTDRLGIAPSTYSWLNHYDDRAVWRVVDTYGERALSIAGGTGYCTPLYDQVSKALYLEIFHTFPADFITRGLAAANKVIGHEFWDVPWIQPGPNWERFFINYRDFFHGVFFVSWIAIGLFALAKSVRLGLFAIFALAYLSTHPAIQFDQRHFFHLIFLSWLPVGIVVGWILCAVALALQKRFDVIKKIWGELPSFIAWLKAAAIFVGIIFISYAGNLWIRHEQNEAVKSLFENYLKATGVKADVTSSQISAENIILTIPPPKNKRHVYGYMLRLDIGGDKCSPGTKKMSAELSGLDDRSYVFKKELVFDFSPPRTHATVFFPAYFQQDVLPNFYLSIHRDDIGCVEQASWLHSSELPSLWVGATLYPDWRESKLYQWK